MKKKKIFVILFSAFAFNLIACTQPKQVDVDQIDARSENPLIPAPVQSPPGSDDTTTPPASSQPDTTIPPQTGEDPTMPSDPTPSPEPDPVVENPPEDPAPVPEPFSPSEVFSLASLQSGEWAASKNSGTLLDDAAGLRIHGNLTDQSAFNVHSDFDDGQGSYLEARIKRQPGGE